MYEAITKYANRFGTGGEWIGKDDMVKGDTISIPFFSPNEMVRLFLDDMRQFMMTHYDEMLEEIKEKQGLDSSGDADVSTLDGEEVLALLTGVIRSDRFVEGLLASYIKAGKIDEWLHRLQEIDEEFSSKDTLSQIDYAIKEIWKYDISRDYYSSNTLKEDSLKCCIYYHLRRKLGDIFKRSNLHIFSEYYFPDLGYKADLAIVRVNPNSEEGHLRDTVTDVLAVIELKFTNSASTQTANWVKQDIVKLKNYIQTGKLDCQFYFAVIYEVECSSLNWMDKRSTNNWAAGRVTELDAGYIDGEMRFEVNSYNGLNEDL